MFLLNLNIEVKSDAPKLNAIVLLSEIYFRQPNKIRGAASVSPSAKG
jgi:hypothetical protein